MANIGEVIKKYIELRDRLAEMAERHRAEAAPLNDSMGALENYLMHTMNTMGVDQLKEGGAGTAFKSHSTSVQLQDAAAFKEYVFEPAVDGVVNYLRATGIGLREDDCTAIAQILLTMPKWDMIDFRAGKKGITEFIKTENTPVPGVAINTTATVNIRRA